MTNPSPNLAIPLRTAIVSDAAITALLPAFLGSYPVFTRRPVPDTAPYPMIVVTEDIGVSDNDGVNDFRPSYTRAILVYSTNDTPENSRKATSIGLLVRDLFHRQKNAIVVTGWTVTQILATGPAPTFADDQNLGVAVTLAIQLATPRT